MSELSKIVSMLQYHQKTYFHFKKQTKTWDYFANATKQAEQLEQLKNELLKNTYKYESVNHQSIFDKLEFIKKNLQLETLQVFVYQAPNIGELNASIILIKDEAHIILTGNIIEILTDDELEAVLAHEIGHVLLYRLEHGVIEITDRIVTAIGNSIQSDVAHYETARKFKLYTEIFCDKMAFQVCKNINPLITSLVTITTGVKNISADSYLQQTEEILSANKAFKSENYTHPENFIRAKALQLWQTEPDKAEDQIIKLIGGFATIDTLDIFQQSELKELTRTVIELFLKPKWIQTTLVINHAKQFFLDFHAEKSVFLDSILVAKLDNLDTSIREYLGYLLFDFTKVDSSLENVPLGWAFEFADAVFIKNEFVAIVKKENKFSEKKFTQLKDDALAQYHLVKEGENEQIYEA
jgi:Peptidase family M48